MLITSDGWGGGKINEKTPLSKSLSNTHRLFCYISNYQYLPHGLHFEEFIINFWWLFFTWIFFCLFESGAWANEGKWLIQELNNSTSDLRWLLILRHENEWSKKKLVIYGRIPIRPSSKTANKFYREMWVKLDWKIV